MEDFLLALALILLFGRGLGLLTRKIGIHSMLGEVIAGLILGPLALYLTSGSYGLHQSSAMDVLSEFSIIMIMLLSGLSTDFHSFNEKKKDSIVVGTMGVIVSFILIFLPLLLVFHVSFVASLFISAILSNTAIEVCSWLLKDVYFSSFKAVVIGASFVDDILAVYIIGIVSSLVFTGSIPSFQDLLWLSFKVGAFLTLVFFLGDKVFGYTAKWFGRTGKKMIFTLTLIFAFLLALSARLVGLHEVIGAYMGGLMVAKWYSRPDPMLRSELRRRELVEDIEPLLLAIFGPLFFVYVGITLPLSSGHLDLATISFIAVIFILAILGKLVGCGTGAFFMGASKKESILVGVAMGGRGALEMVLLNFGMTAGVIGSNQFLSLVIVTLLTIVTTPILYSIAQKHLHM